MSKIGVLSPKDAGARANARVAEWVAEKRRAEAEGRRGGGRNAEPETGNGKPKTVVDASGPLLRPTSVIVLPSGRMIAPLCGEDGKIIKAGYLEARRLAADGNLELASNLAHDECLMSQEWEKIGGWYPAWAREIVAHPAKDGTFAMGCDIVDSQTGWVLPWSEIVRLVQPGEIVGEGVGLFIGPTDVVEDRGRVVVLPAYIIVLRGFIQENGGLGKLDAATGIPLAVSPEEYARLPDNEKRRVMRTEGLRVGPVWRGYGYYGLDDNNWRGVFLGGRPSDGLGVAIEIPRGGAQKTGGSP